MEQRRPLLSARAGALFLLPAFLCLLIFLIFPFLWIFRVSFTNETLTGASALNPEWVGLNNYTSLFDFGKWLTRGQFGNALLVTFQFVIGSALIGQVGLGLALAIAFYRRKGAFREFV